MKRILCTFSGAAYDSTTQLIVENAPRFGVDEVRVYDDAWLLSTGFVDLNKWLWSFEDGTHFGWCSWKPFIILEEFKRVTEGDVVLYVDADTYPIADLSPIFNIATRDGIMLFESQGNNNNRFTRSDCWVAMGARLDSPGRTNSQHACGRFQAFKKGVLRNNQFLMEWLTYSLNPFCQGHRGSVIVPDLKTFGRHSGEQSVLSLLALKYNIPLHREACQFGWPVQPNTGQPEDTYPQLFVQRFREGDPADLSGSRFRNV